MIGVGGEIAHEIQRRSCYLINVNQPDDLGLNTSAHVTESSETAAVPDILTKRIQPYKALPDTEVASIKPQLRCPSPQISSAT